MNGTGKIIPRQHRQALRIKPFGRRTLILLSFGREGRKGLNLRDLELKNAFGGHGKIKILTLSRL